MNKICTKCAKRRVLSQFSRDLSKKDGLHCWCKPCHLVNYRAWVAQASVKERQLRRARATNRSRLWRIRNPERSRDNYFRNAYGISLSDFKNQIKHQKYGCAICCIRLKKPAVDHCHKTGRFRGILCIRCNGAIGALGDSVAGLRRAIRYLRG